MKKFFLITGILFGVIIIALIAVPVLFKDDIQNALDKTLDESLNAKVFYDADQFGVSLFSNFPDFTVSMGDFGIAGVEEFVGDTLVYVGSFQITIDLMSVIGGDQIKINEVALNDPKIEILVMEDGKANYDIAKESGEEETVEEDSEDSSDSNISIAVEKWSITNGQMIYLDQSMHFYTTLLGLNHEGTGDFTLDVFDMKTMTEVGSVSLSFEGEEYISNKTLMADVTMNMDLGQMTFTFKENRIAVNDFAIGAEGYISMPSEDIEMDIAFGGKDISLKSILSLIPGAYQSYLDGVTASGDIGFDGIVKGVFNDNSMPQIAANLSVDNGKIVYAEYPIPMEAIDIKSSFNYPSADLAETSFNVDKFHMLVDGEELSAYLKFKNLDNYNWDFGFDGNVDLEKITKIVPLEGMDLKGKINAKLNTKGVMADVEAEKYENLPTSGGLTIKEFEFSSEDLPQGFAIQSAQLNFDPSEIALKEFKSTVGNTDMSLDGSVSNYLAYALGENELLTGRLNFQSQLVDVNEWMTEEEVEEEVAEDTTESAPLEVIRIPENIDFTLESSISKISYTNLSLDNFKGKILIKDGAVRLEDNSFNMLDGAFELAGSYVTKDLEKPKYDFSFGIKDLSISQAYNSFETVQQYVPIARQISGDFSTNFSVDGTLGEDMMPLLDEMSLAGLVNIAQAALEKGEFVQQLSSLTSLKAANGGGTDNSISVKDVLVKTSIENGRLFVEPFDLNVSGQKATVGGSNSLDGKLDYVMTMNDVPTGAVGEALNSAINSLVGGSSNLISDKVDLNFGITGTTDKPKVSLLSSGASSGQSASSSAKAAVQAEIDKQKAEAEAKLKAEKEKAEAKAKAAAEDAKKKAEAEKKKAEEEAKKKLEAEKKKAEEEAKKKLKKLFGGR